jgi:hypothetical protein
MEIVGWSVGRAAWALGVSIREYRELEVGTRSPTFDGWKAEPPARRRSRLRKRSRG